MTATEPEWYEARRLALATGPRLPIEILPLDRLAGRVLAENLCSCGPVPSYASSAMDGYAVAGPGPWRIVGRVLAGDLTARRIEAGHAMQIATGGMIPAGCDGILRSEDAVVEPAAKPQPDKPLGTGSEPDASAGDCSVRVRQGAPDPHGLHCRPAAAEAAQGDLLAPAGTVLTPPLIGLAAASGHDELPVVVRPRVAPVLLGDELLHSGVAAPGQVRDVLGPQLPSFMRALGAECADPVFVPDELPATIDALSSARGDVVVTTGSTAHGPRDLLHRALEELNARLIIDTVAMRPGHPMLLAELGDGRPLVGLPGNPLSASAGLLTLLDPLLRGMAGRDDVRFTREHVAAAVDGHRGMTRLAPVTRTADGLMVTQWTGSGMLRGLAGADAFAVVPAGGAEPGDRIAVLPLPWGQAF